MYVSNIAIVKSASKKFNLFTTLNIVFKILNSHWRCMFVKTLLFCERTGFLKKRLNENCKTFYFTLQPQN